MCPEKAPGMKLSGMLVPMVTSFFFPLILGHVDDLLPYFLSYAKRLYPVLDCLEDLKEISDFRGPADL